MHSSLINLQRVYGSTAPFGQNSFLVDRLWPRGISKEQLQGVNWLKDVAPSNELRKWYHQHLEEWDIFYQKYQQELENNTAVTPLYNHLKANEQITLLYGSKNDKQNHAIVLRDFLLNSLKAK